MHDVAFFIWCRDDESWLDRCLSTFRATTPSVHMLGIANACTDSTVNIFNRYGLEVVGFQDHHSTSCCVNLGYSILSTRGYDYIGWIHPDCAFNHPGWLETLRNELDKYPQIGRLCAWNEKDDDKKDAHPTIYPGAEAANLIHKRTWDLVGPYDESFIGSAYEDWDMQRRFIEHGLATCVTKNSVFWHRHAGTRSKYDPITRAREWDYNRNIYQRKWPDGENRFAPAGFALTE